ncbi:MAG: hypothetical protein K2L07_02690 [Lachnospiraceae bacterium]|nr:hypothetical protein [Lachnospiraceae bacterium]
MIQQVHYDVMVKLSRIQRLFPVTETMYESRELQISISLQGLCSFVEYSVLGGIANL